MGMHFVLPFPRYGAAVVSVERYLYVSGRLIGGMTVKNDLRFFEAMRRGHAIR